MYHMLFVHSLVHGTLWLFPPFGYYESYCYEHWGIYKYLFESLFSILLNINLGVEMLLNT